MFRNRVKEYILDNGKGIVINDKKGLVEYLLEYDEEEENIIERDTEGNILDFFNSGEMVDLSMNKEEETHLENIYKDWKYYEKEVEYY